MICAPPIFVVFPDHITAPKGVESRLMGSRMVGISCFAVWLCPPGVLLAYGRGEGPKKRAVALISLCFTGQRRCCEVSPCLWRCEVQRVKDFDPQQSKLRQYKRTAVRMQCVVKNTTLCVANTESRWFRDHDSRLWFARDIWRYRNVFWLIGWLMSRPFRRCSRVEVRTTTVAFPAECSAYSWIYYETQYSAILQ